MAEEKSCLREYIEKMKSRTARYCRISVLVDYVDGKYAVDWEFGGYTELGEKLARRFGEPKVDLSGPTSGMRNPDDDRRCMHRITAMDRHHVEKFEHIIDAWSYIKRVVDDVNAEFEEREENDKELEQIFQWHTLNI